MNKVYDREVIPKQWQQGNIIRLYKGKGTKGKCSAERGITLASNTGKLFERLINNRIKKEIKTSEAQGTFSLLADVGPPSACRRRPTIGLPPAGHRWLATVVPTMPAILKNIRSENTCVLRLSQGVRIFWL